MLNSFELNLHGRHDDNQTHENSRFNKSRPRLRVELPKKGMSFAEGFSGELALPSQLEIPEQTDRAQRYDDRYQTKPQVTR
jgi:hypothetical protein